MKKESTEVLAMLRNALASLSTIAKSADLPAPAFLIGMAELEATQAGNQRQTRGRYQKVA